jgi:hypothetical protein
MRIFLFIIFLFGLLNAKEYSIIAFSTKKFNLKTAKLFIKRFPDGVVKKYTRFIEYKIEPFKDYKSAKEFLKKVKKYYKYPLIIPYNPHLGEVLYPKKIGNVQKKIINKKAKKIKTFTNNSMSNNKNIETEQKLTYCKTKCGCRVPKKYSWEINSSKILSKINVKVGSYLEEENLSTFNNKNIVANISANKENVCFLPESDYSFYVDLYGSIYKGQKNNSISLYGNSANIKLGLIYEKYFANKWKFYTDDRVILSRKSFRGKSDTNIYIDINELYVRSYCLNNNLSNILIGRKKTKDYRSWIYDMPLDQIRIFSEGYLLNYEAILATRINDEKVTDDITKRDLKHSQIFIFHTDYQYMFNHFAELYYMYEKIKPQTTYTKRLFNYVGADFHGKKDNIIYWLNILYSFGKFDYLAYILKDKGIGFDIGMKIKNSESFAYAFSLAYGDGEFHQPYIATNYSTYLKKYFNYKYYGYVLDPVLDNLQILSLYGIKDFSEFSKIIFSFHNYRQSKTKIQNYNTSYFFNTNGKSKNIGNEFDFVYQYLRNRYQKLKFGVGYFLGGSAFDVDKKSAYRLFLNYRQYWK